MSEPDLAPQKLTATLFRISKEIVEFQLMDEPFGTIKILKIIFGFCPPKMTSPEKKSFLDFANDPPLEHCATFFKLCQNSSFERSMLRVL